MIGECKLGAIVLILCAKLVLTYYCYVYLFFQLLLWYCYC